MINRSNRELMEIVTARSTMKEWNIQFERDGEIVKLVISILKMAVSCTNHDCLAYLIVHEFGSGPVLPHLYLHQLTVLQM